MTALDRTRIVRRFTTHVRGRASGPIWSMGLLLGAYVVVLLMRGVGFHPLVHEVLGSLSGWVPATVCWLAAYRTGFRSWPRRP